jgi:hypothetical protein
VNDVAISWIGFINSLLLLAASGIFGLCCKLFIRYLERNDALGKKLDGQARELRDLRTNCARFESKLDLEPFPYIE